MNKMAEIKKYIADNQKAMTQIKVDAIIEIEGNRLKAIESVEKSRNELILHIVCNCTNIDPAMLQAIGIKMLDSSVFKSTAFEAMASFNAATTTESDAKQEKEEEELSDDYQTET